MRDDRWKNDPSAAEVKSSLQTLLAFCADEELTHTHTTFPAQRHARALGPDKIQTNFEGMGVFLGLVGTRTSFEVGVVVGVHPWF